MTELEVLTDGPELRALLVRMIELLERNHQAGSARTLAPYARSELTRDQRADLRHMIGGAGTLGDLVLNPTDPQRMREDNDELEALRAEVYDRCVPGGPDLSLVISRRTVWLGAVSRAEGGSCAYPDVRLEGTPEESATVGPECTFTVELANDRFEDDEPGVLRASSPDGSVFAETPASPTRDPRPVCLGDSCPVPASLWITVSDANGVAVSGARVRVSSRAGARSSRGDCAAEAGTCFVHGLLAGTSVTVRAEMPDGRSAALGVKLLPGVADVVVKLPKTPRGQHGR